MARSTLALVPRSNPETLPGPPACGPEADFNRERIEEVTASMAEMAEVLGISEDATRARARRGHWVTHKDFPSEKQIGKTETRVYIRHLSKDLIRRLRRFRRAKEREEQGLARHPGGLVVRSDDGRLKITPAITQLIHALYRKREQPGFEWVFEQLMDRCPFCEKGRMAPAVRGFAARYKSARCEHCRQTLSYSSIRRICLAAAPMPTLAAREGWNAVHNKFITKGRIARGEYRNAIVVGDHHRIDLWAWDSRRPFHQGGNPRLVRYWMSAWQDEATGVVEFAIGERANVRLILEALYRYALQFGMPIEIRTDNGKDYLSQEFLRFWKASGIKYQHKSLPSCRTGESHGKSKVIERWFGTFERDVMRFLPGWCGTHPKERPDDVLWPQTKQHEEFLRNPEGKASPFLTFQQVERKIREWVEGIYHRRETKRLNMTPLEAFQSGTASLRELKKEELMILMLHPEARVIGSNGVSVNGINYWCPEFSHYKGLACDVRIDCEDLSSVIALVGKERRILVALADDPEVRAAAPSEEERKKVFQQKKIERQIIRQAFEFDQQRLAGRRPWDAILEERAAEAGTMKMAVNGDYGSTVRVLNEGGTIARALSSRSQKSGVRSQDSEFGRPEPSAPLLVPSLGKEPVEAEEAETSFISSAIERWKSEPEQSLEHEQDAETNAD